MAIRYRREIAPGWRLSATAANVISASPMVPSRNCAADLLVEFRSARIMDSSRVIHINALHTNYPSKGPRVPTRCRMMSRSQLRNQKRTDNLPEIRVHDSDIDLPLSRLQGNTACPGNKGPALESIDEGDKTMNIKLNPLCLGGFLAL